MRPSFTNSHFNISFCGCDITAKVDEKDTDFMSSPECMHLVDLIVAHGLGLLCTDIETNVT